jgi:hypothetical protein
MPATVGRDVNSTHGKHVGSDGLTWLQAQQWNAFRGLSGEPLLCFQCNVYQCVEVSKHAKVQFHFVPMVLPHAFPWLPMTFDGKCCCLHLHILQLLHTMRSFQWSRLNNPDLCLHSGNVARRLRRLREGWNLSATYFPADMKLESIWTQVSWQSHTINQVNQVQK